MAQGYFGAKRAIYARYAESYDEDRRLMIGEEARRRRNLWLVEPLKPGLIVLDAADFFAEARRVLRSDGVLVAALFAGGFLSDRSTASFAASAASASASRGLGRFNRFAEIMSELRTKGHDPSQVRQGVALIQARR